jgi:hypothetical protein
MGLARWITRISSSSSQLRFPDPKLSAIPQILSAVTCTNSAGSKRVRMES